MKLGENMPKFGSCPQGVHFCGLMDRVDTEWTPLFSRFCRCVHCVFPLILRSDFSISISAFRFQRSSNPLTSFSVPAARALRASSRSLLCGKPSHLIAHRRNFIGYHAEFIQTHAKKKRHRSCICRKFAAHPNLLALLMPCRDYLCHRTQHRRMKGAIKLGQLLVAAICRKNILC